MAKVEHYNKKAMAHVIKEAYRELGKYKNNVDLSRSGENWHYENLDSSKDMQVAIQKRVNDIMQGRNVQDKTNIVSSWVVSLPKNFQGEPKEFFDVVYHFCKNRYGEDNVIDGVVHMDEDNPHIHVFLVPEATSRKTGLNTVSSASKFTRTELSKFHTDLDKECEIQFKQSKLVRNGKTLQNGLELDDFKMVTQMSDGFTEFLKTKTVNKEKSITAYDKLTQWLDEYNNTLKAPQKAQEDEIEVKSGNSKAEPEQIVSAASETPQKASETPQRSTVDILRDEERNEDTDSVEEIIKSVEKKPVVSEVTQKTDALGYGTTVRQQQAATAAHQAELNANMDDFEVYVPDQTPLYPGR